MGAVTGINQQMKLTNATKFTISKMEKHIYAAISKNIRLHPETFISSMAIVSFRKNALQSRNKGKLILNGNIQDTVSQYIIAIEIFPHVRD